MIHGPSRPLHWFSSKFMRSMSSEGTKINNISFALICTLPFGKMISPLRTIELMRTFCPRGSSEIFYLYLQNPQ